MKNVSLIEISQKEFELIQHSNTFEKEENYFQNGVIFEIESDNPIAFMIDENPSDDLSLFRYFKIVME